MNRKDFLTLFTTSMLVVGGGGLALVLGVASGAANEADEEVAFDASRVPLDGQVITKWRGNPIAVVRRSSAVQQAALISAKLRSATRMPARPAREPRYADNALRSVRPEIFVYVPICTFEGTVILMFQGGATSACPVCGSRFDPAGRRVYGPPRVDLLVPPYRLRGQTVVLGPYEVIAPITGQLIRGNRTYEEN